MRAVERRSLRYQITRGALVALVIAIAIGTAKELLEAVMDGMPGAQLVLAFLIIVVFTACLLTWRVRQKASADDAGIIVGTLLRVRIFPWRDVQAIVIEQDRANGRMPKLYVAGHRFPIALKALWLERRGFELDEMVAPMRRMWEESRGGDWMPDALMQKEISERQLYGESPWTYARFPASLVAAMMATGLVVNLGTERTMPLWNLLFNFGTLMGFPLVVYAAAFFKRKSEIDAMRRRNVERREEHSRNATIHQPW